MLIGVNLTIEQHWLVAARLLVAHIEYLVARPQVFLRSAMALQAPLHLQRGVIEHERHTINRAVASIAANPFVDVNAVIEVNEIGQIVDPRPDERLA